MPTRRAATSATVSSFDAAPERKPARTARSASCSWAGDSQNSEHPVAHVFGHETAVASDRAPSMRPDTHRIISRMSSGSSRADIAVEPTRSADITVSGDARRRQLRAVSGRC